LSLFFDDAFESTCLKVAAAQVYINHRESRSVLGGSTNELFVFCDGSSSGWHGACLVDPVGGKVTQRQRFREPTSNRNIGSEFAGLHLALLMAPSDARLTVVFDLLGIGQWMLGHFQRHDPVVKEACDVCWDLVSDKTLHVTWVHHRGHQKDPSDFTRYNNVADHLCKANVLEGRTVTSSFGGTLLT